MDKEYIEKVIENKVNTYYSDDEYPSDISDIKSDARTMFRAGAEWRINSVWHRPNEKPENDRLVLCVCGGGGFALISGPNNSQFCRYSYELGFEYWAYVEDLLPTKE